MIVNLGPTFGKETELLGGYNGSRFFRTGVFEKPLFGKAWFDWHIRPFAETDLIHIGLLFFQKTQFL